MDFDHNYNNCRNGNAVAIFGQILINTLAHVTKTRVSRPSADASVGIPTYRRDVASALYLGFPAIRFASAGQALLIPFSRSLSRRMVGQSFLSYELAYFVQVPM